MTPKKSATKRRARRSNVYTELLETLKNMREPVASPFPVLGNECSRGHRYLALRAQVQKKPITSLSAAVLITSLQGGVLQRAELDEILGRFYLNSPEWLSWIESVFTRMTGRTPDTRTAQSTYREATALWEQVKLVYTEDELQFLEHAWRYAVEKERKFTYAERQKYYYKPLSFDDPHLCGNAPVQEVAITIQPARSSQESAIDERTESLLDLFALTFYMRALPDRQEKMRQLWAKNKEYHLLSVIGYTPDEIQPEPEPAPEDVPADDQDAIDTAFNDLMKGLDL